MKDFLKKRLMPSVLFGLTVGSILSIWAIIQTTEISDDNYGKIIQLLKNHPEKQEELEIYLHDNQIDCQEFGNLMQNTPNNNKVQLLKIIGKQK
jgi:hypothetical protein